ncbi:glycosyltransferase family 39 protein [PVC group bacterium]|nr:glycosyltransferase family 39 protein [PVC group bacterium]
MTSYHKYKHTFWLLIILLLALGLRCYGLGLKSLWIDEVGSLLTVRQSWGDMLRYIVQIDAHPPLYYVFLSIWSRIFGMSEIALRSLSVLLGCLVILGFYCLGRAWIHKDFGLLLAFLGAVSNYQVYFSQEARPYILVLLVFCVSYALFIRWARRPNIWGLYGMMCLHLLGAYTFLYYWVPIIVLELLAFVILLKKKQMKILMHFFYSKVLLGLLYVPWIFVVLEKIRKIADITEKSDTMMQWAIPNALCEYFFGIWRPEDILQYGFLLGGILTVLIMPLFIRSWRRAGALNFFVLMGIIGGIFLLPGKIHVFESKHMIFAAVPLLAGFGFVCYHIKSKALRYLVVSVYVILNLCSFLVYYDHDFQKERWREVAGIFSKAEDLADGVIINPGFAGYALDYYYQGGLERMGVSASTTSQQLKDFISEKIGCGSWNYPDVF